MKRTAFVLVGASLLLTVTLSASAASRKASANPELQKAETCIREALRGEDLAIRYIREGKISHHNIVVNVINTTASDAVSCAIVKVVDAEAPALDEISGLQGGYAVSDLQRAGNLDREGSDELLRGESIGKVIGTFDDASALKKSALAVLEKATAPAPTTPTAGAARTTMPTTTTSTPPAGKVVELEVGLYNCGPPIVSGGPSIVSAPIAVENPGAKLVIYVADFNDNTLVKDNRCSIYTTEAAVINPATGKQLLPSFQVFPQVSVSAGFYECKQHPELGAACAGKQFVWAITVFNLYTYKPPAK